ncbi:hypothetical protein LTR64_003060 [Lithohypha guttulata]|uniref:uncharacterized protein n=1 Tax=Lithohypha guttulata TaxID=1690604 RepID=UPI00315DC859
MMILPRSYVQAIPRRTRSMEFSEKTSHKTTRSPSGSTRTKSPRSPSLFSSRDSSPAKSVSHGVRIKVQKPSPSPASDHENVPQRPPPTPLSEKVLLRRRRESATDILSSTAIPIRRKPRGRPSQRLPKGDHVANFSTLIMGDVKPHSTGSLPKSASNSNLEVLFGNMDELLEEGQMYVGSEGFDSSVLSTRSLSDDSVMSFPSPDNLVSDDCHSQHSDASTSVPERRLRQIALSEDCSDDHPLALPSKVDDPVDYPEAPVSPPARSPLARDRSTKKPRTSLRSGLSASLKALKSAAQSVSNRSSSDAATVHAPTLFDFHPALTDDRRPPPSLDEPGPELRRYLNPPPLDSAAQLNTWQDHRHSNFDNPPSRTEPRRRSPRGKKTRGGRSPSPPGTNPRIHDLPAVVQLADCLPPSVRTEHASSPPIWLTQDGTPVNKSTAISLLYDPNANEGKGEPAGLRHREPRENRDFLRVFVCEMQMRRNGKLSDDLGVGRARLWLPPANNDRNPEPAAKRDGDEVAVAEPGRVRQKKSAKERMICLNMDDL